MRASIASASAAKEWMPTSVNTTWWSKRLRPRLPNPGKGAGQRFHAQPMEKKLEIAMNAYHRVLKRHWVSNDTDRKES